MLCADVAGSISNIHDVKTEDNEAVPLKKAKNKNRSQVMKGVGK